MSIIFKEPAALEERPLWSDVPKEIISKIENLLKDKIISGKTLFGGYSPSAVFFIKTVSGKSFFMKGTHPKQDTHGVKMLNQEIDVYRKISIISSLSPKYIGFISDEDEDGWMLAIFEYVETVPVLPWSLIKIENVFDLLIQLHFLKEKDVFLNLENMSEKNFVKNFLKPKGGWLRIRDEEKIKNKFLSLFENTEDGKKWLKIALPKLCALQESVFLVKEPIGILHQDLRSDNILFSKDKKTYFIDWPNACYGPIVFDLALFLPSIASESDFSCQRLLEIYIQRAKINISHKDLSIALSSISGYFADNAYRSIPEKLPRLRWMQKRVLWAMLEWLSHLAETPLPPAFRKN